MAFQLCRANVWCRTCRRPVELLATTGTVVWQVIIANCHGERAVTAMKKVELRRIEATRLWVFGIDDNSLRDRPREVLRLPGCPEATVVDVEAEVKRLK